MTKVKKFNFSFFTSIALILSTFLHFYRINVFSVKPSDLIMAILVTLLFRFTYKYLISKKTLISYTYILAGIFFSVILATTLGYFKYGLIFDDSSGVRLILKLLLNIFSFFTVLFILGQNNKTLKPLIISFWAPYFIYLLLIFIPDKNVVMYLDQKDLAHARLMGFGSNPNDISYNLFMAMPLMLPFLSNKKNNFFLFLKWTGFSFLFFLMLWSGSRVPITICFISFLFYFFDLYRFNSIKLNFSTLLIPVCAFFISFSLLYLRFPYVINMVIHRFIGVDFSAVSNGSDSAITTSALTYLKDSVLTPSTFANVRLLPFDHYFNLALSNPLGIGVNYYPKLAFLNTANGELMATESFLDTFIHGGFVLVLLAFIFSFKIITTFPKNLNQYLLRNKENFFILLSLRASFFSGLILFLIGGFQMYASWTWIIAAMILSFNVNE